MEDEVFDDLKNEAKQGVAQIVAKIFSTLLEPILIGIDKVKEQLYKRLDAYNVRKTMSFIENSSLLYRYLDEHNFDCVVFVMHNGIHSSSGLGCKFLTPQLENVQSPNEMLGLFKSMTLPLSKTYIEWIYYCFQHKAYTRSEFNNEMMLYFDDYEKLFFRTYRGVFYIVMSGESVLTNDDENYINSIIDSLLENNIGRSKII